MPVYSKERPELQLESFSSQSVPVDAAGNPGELAAAARGCRSDTMGIWENRPDLDTALPGVDGQRGRTWSRCSTNRGILFRGSRRRAGPEMCHFEPDSYDS